MLEIMEAELTSRQKAALERVLAFVEDADEKFFTGGWTPPSDADAPAGPLADVAELRELLVRRKPVVFGRPCPHDEARRVDVHVNSDRVRTIESCRVCRNAWFGSYARRLLDGREAWGPIGEWRYCDRGAISEARERGTDDEVSSR